MDIEAKQEKTDPEVMAAINISIKMSLFIIAGFIICLTIMSLWYASVGRDPLPNLESTFVIEYIDTNGILGYEDDDASTRDEVEELEVEPFILLVGIDEDKLEGFSFAFPIEAYKEQIYYNPQVGDKMILKFNKDFDIYYKDELLYELSDIVDSVVEYIPIEASEGD